MPRKNMIYEAYCNDELVKRGTAIELADFFNVTPPTIGNCERTGRKVKGRYRLERVGLEDMKSDVELDEAIKKDLAQGISRNAIAERLGLRKNTVDGRIQAMKKRGEL